MATYIWRSSLPSGYVSDNSGRIFKVSDLPPDSVFVNQTTGARVNADGTPYQSAPPTAPTAPPPSPTPTTPSSPTAPPSGSTSWTAVYKTADGLWGVIIDGVHQNARSDKDVQVSQAQNYGGNFIGVLDNVTMFGTPEKVNAWVKGMYPNFKMPTAATPTTPTAPTAPTSSIPSGARKLGPNEYANLVRENGVTDANFSQYFYRDTNGDIYLLQNAPGPNAPPPTTYTDPVGQPQYLPGTKFPFDPTKGNYALVRFTSDPTPENTSDNYSYWLYDGTTKAFHPILDMSQLEAVAKSAGITGGATQMILNAVPLAPEDLKDESLGWGNTFLSSEYAPIGGQLPTYVPGVPQGTAAKNKYGQEAYSDTQVQKAGVALFTAVEGMVKQGVLPESTLNDLQAGSGALFKKYAAAMLYGGYSYADVAMDIKLTQLAKADPKTYANMQVVSEMIEKDRWQNSDAYKKAVQSPQLATMPMSEIDSVAQLSKYPIYAIPDDVWSGLVLGFDVTDPQWKERARGVEAPYYDLLLARAQAKTDQEVLIAEENWRNEVDRINRTYGMQLSNNAREAWNQVLQMQGSYQQRNLADSGLHQEVQDRYLGDVRRSNDYIRENKLDEESSKLRQYLLTSASPQQVNEAIAKMDGEDAAKGVPPEKFRSKLWGLMPSSETMAALDYNELKKKFPEMTDEQIRMLRNTVVDDNGHYMSEMYRTAIGNKLDLQRDKETWQQQEYLNKKVAEADKKFAPWTNSTFNFTVNGTQDTPSVNGATGTKTVQVSKDGVTKTIQEADLPYWTGIQKWTQVPNSSSSQAPTAGSSGIDSVALMGYLKDKGVIGGQQASTAPATQPQAQNASASPDWGAIIKNLTESKQLNPGPQDPQSTGIRAAAERLFGSGSNWTPEFRQANKTDIANWNYATMAKPGEEFVLDPKTGKITSRKV